MIYVVAQFILLAILAWPTAELFVSAISILGVVFILLSGGIALLAVIANRPGNFNVHPTPKSGGRLITSGIYRYIRHPMYSSLFFAGIGLLFCQFSLWKLVAWVLLLFTLALKARVEERALVLLYSEYKSYQTNTYAFIPLLW